MLLTLRRTFVRILAGAAAVALPVALVSPASAAVADSASDSSSKVVQTVLYYDDSQASQYSEEIKAGMESWNNTVENVQIQPVEAGQQANIVIIADDGWPRAELGPVGPGQQVTWWFGKQAVDQGYDKIRIAAHETGHSLGLPDMKPGPCSSLMSGSTGGVDCTNATPNAEEAQMVEDNYAGGFVAPHFGPRPLIVDQP